MNKNSLSNILNSDYLVQPLQTVLNTSILPLLCILLSSSMLICFDTIDIVKSALEIKKTIHILNFKEQLTMIHAITKDDRTHILNNVKKKKKWSKIKRKGANQDH